MRTVYARIDPAQEELSILRIASSTGSSYLDHDEVVYDNFFNSSFVELPVLLSWIAILIDYLELPVMADLFTRSLGRRKDKVYAFTISKLFLQTLVHLSKCPNHFFHRRKYFEK